MYPAYLKSHKDGALRKVIDRGVELLESCSICPRKCKVNRLKGQKGFCRVGLKPIVYNYMPHPGEEPPISGERGSGTIFFSGCNMSCSYCQNFKFSQEGEGREVDFDELAGFMLELQNKGCHNINLVTPTHIMPQILKSLDIAVSRGLKIPLVYNTSGYELAEIIRLLEDIIDIYLADMRYGETAPAAKYSAAPDYPFYNQGALKEMFRQAPAAEFDKNGIIKKGVIIRHLVLPGGASGTPKVMEFISRKLSKKAYISLMSQYYPYYKASGIPDISRRITRQEYQEAERIMSESGLTNGWTQDSNGSESLAGAHLKGMLKDEK